MRGAETTSGEEEKNNHDKVNGRRLEGKEEKEMSTGDGEENRQTQKDCVEE